MAKLLKLRRGNTSAHGSFTGAEGEVTVDTDKESLVVHNGSTAGGFALLREDLSNLPAGTIDNADINASAAIAGTKISPDFGSQNIVTSGTVDGKDISALGITGTTLDNGVTATTQSAGDNSTKVATTAYTDTAISNLVDSSPSTLNTLNELAAALGDDANFSTTVTNSIATKLPLAGGTMTGNIDHNDNVRARYGTNDDLQIYHSGTNNVIDSNNNWLNITSDGGVAIRHEVQADGSDGENMALFKPDGAVELYHDDSKTLETTSTGVTVTGALTATGDVTAFSDQTLKKDVTTINNALGLCGKLRGVSYKWIKDDRPSIGVIAQEIEQHIPEIVLTTELDGKYVKSVDYGKIVGVLINAVNELKAELDEYKATYADLTIEDFKDKPQEELDKIVLVQRKGS